MAEAKKRVPDGKIRLVVEIDAQRGKALKVLSDLFGRPQYDIVQRAITDYVNANRQAVDNFLQIRADVRRRNETKEPVVQQEPKQETSEPEFSLD